MTTPPRIHVIRGLPASGKTTLATRITAVHVQLDTHRRRLWPDCPRSWDPYSGRGMPVQEAFEAEIAALLADGRDVVADRTNLATEGLRRLERLGPLTVHDLRRVPVADCIARDACRPPGVRVGAAGIRALADRWL